MSIGKIVIVDDEPITRMDIRDILEEANYDVVGEAADGFEAIELAKSCKPDLMIMDIEMPLLDGLKAGKHIMENHFAGGIIYLSAYSDKDMTNKAKNLGANGYLVKPLDEQSLVPMVEMCIARGVEQEEMRQLNERLQEQLDDRKQIEKAKGLIMKERHLSEEEAFQFLRKISMQRRVKMKDVANIILGENE